MLSSQLFFSITSSKLSVIKFAFHFIKKYLRLNININTMKKLLYLFICFVLGTSIASANPITLAVAKKVAENFYSKSSEITVSSVTLAFTETSSSGLPVYFVFNINENDGFVIVSAEDAGHAIIGYSTQKRFVQPANGSNISNWLYKRKNEIEEIRVSSFSANVEIVKEWNSYQNNQKSVTSIANTMSVAPLVQTTWDQAPYYNAMCPSGSMTGCVATAMAQIMKFWSYPATGTGSSSYCDCTSGGYTNNYGTLSANYGTTTYNWSNMPINVSSANTDVALLNYQCGVSVEMDYDPNGSGAQVIDYGPGYPSAQHSYITYFGYDPSTIQGLDRAGYSDPQWINILKADLNIGRPIQYIGVDATYGGHTWVCDGYDANDNFHMNWGWGGNGDGYYSINSLNPGSLVFSNNNGALLGIQPMANIAVDAGVAAVISPAGLSCSGTVNPSVKIKNFGINTLISLIINYKIDNNPVQTQAWSGSLASGQFVNVALPSMTTTSGNHTLTCFTSNPNSGIDGNATNDQFVSSFNVSITGASLPLVEGLESSTNIPSGWALYNPDNDAAWEISTTVSHTGSHCIGFNNSDGNGAADMTGKTDGFLPKSYNMSSGISTLTFDVAYTPCSYQGTVYSDTLAIYASSDCGANWNQVYRKGGTGLATAPTYIITNSVVWSPSASEWRTETVNLASMAGQPNVLIVFENISGWGDWLFLDNINISNTVTEISSVNTSEDFEIYPNPAHDNLTVKALQNINSIQIVNMLGQDIINVGQRQEHAAQIDISSLPAGVYFVKVTTADTQKLVKVIKQ